MVIILHQKDWHTDLKEDLSLCELLGQEGRGGRDDQSRVKVIQGRCDRGGALGRKYTDHQRGLTEPIFWAESEKSRTLLIVGVHAPFARTFQVYACLHLDDELFSPLLAPSISLHKGFKTYHV